ncbi:MAG: pitrilysin family protein [Myxococcota bacterium]|nr:pitrilysin family protein [Myxococcota bacterium]
MKNTLPVVLLVLLTGAACSSSTTQEVVALYSSPEFRKEVPKAGPAPALKAPQGVRQVLDNGLTLSSVEKNDLPLIHLSLRLKSGSASDPAELPGLAGFTGAMLKSGTITRSAQQLADEIEVRGSNIGVSVDDDSTSISFTALAEHFDGLVELVGDMVQNPAFNPEEIERQRSRRLTALAQAADDPRSTANRVFKKAIFGEHPYGHTVLGSEDAIKTITREELQRFYRTHYRPANSAVILVGDITATKAVAKLKAALGTWSRDIGVTEVPQVPKNSTPGVVLVDKPGAPQSQLRIGHLGVSRNNPDYFSIVLCNAILGGAFNSRINMNLREDKGYTYGAGSYFGFRRGVGPFTVYTGVRTDVTGPAIVEVIKEITTIRAEDVTAEELNNAKNRYSLSLPGYFQSVSGIGSMFSNIFIYDLPMTYYQDLPEKLGAVTVADIRKAAQKYLQPDQLAIVVVGDQSKLKDSLQNLQRGTLQLRDPHGNPL